MQIGWIDFSKSERSKVLNVLDLLSEAGTLDELGIAPIRDGYANLFFPGTSTIQTKAKYFFCVPYALKDLERSGETNPNRMFKALSAVEESCGKKLFHDNPKSDGIIGRRALVTGSWVKRAPSDIYWAGIRRLGIFVGGNLSLSEYIRFVSASNNQKGTLKNLGNRNDNSEENERDDIDAGQDRYKKMWNLPTYTSDWMDKLTIELTVEEADFLKKQIVDNCKGTMFAHIMKEHMDNIVNVESFEELNNTFISMFPEEIQTDYYHAVSFSEFVYALRVVYNIIVSNGENEEANAEWRKLEPVLNDITEIDIDAIYHRLGIVNPLLHHFLLDCQKHMKASDIDSLKDTIIKREVHLKGASRAKTKHPGEFDSTSWFGGKRLDYRFGDAKTIINDIFEGEKNCAESEQ